MPYVAFELHIIVFCFQILEKAVDIFNYQGNVLLEICDQKVDREWPDLVSEN